MNISMCVVYLCVRMNVSVRLLYVCVGMNVCMYKHSMFICMCKNVCLYACISDVSMLREFYRVL